jgi:hypothetical protein
VNFDIDPVTTDWPMPEPLPLYEGESANDAAKPSLWARIKARVLEVFSAWAEPWIPL